MRLVKIGTDRFMVNWLLASSSRAPVGRFCDSRVRPQPAFAVTSRHCDAWASSVLVPAAAAWRWAATTSGRFCTASSISPRLTPGSARVGRAPRGSKATAGRPGRGAGRAAASAESATASCAAAAA